MITGPIADESQRTTALALWRYAHDYLRAARMLCDQHKIACVESQVPYHIAAQGLEFALKSYLRVKGLSPAELRTQIGHSLTEALQRCAALGLPAMPAEARQAIEDIAPYHQDSRFEFFPAGHDEFPALDPLFGAGVWILDQIALDVAQDYVLNHAGQSSPSTSDFVRRLRADLSATFAVNVVAN